jgi:hypothetical protein
MKIPISFISIILLFASGFVDNSFGQSRLERKLYPVTENAKYGFASANGDVVITPRFDTASRFSEGLAMVEVDGKNGYINKKGEIVIAPEYEEAEDFSEGLAAVKRGGFWGFIDSNGNEIVATVNVEVLSFSDGLAAVSFQPVGLWGYVNKKGDVVIAPKFFKAFSFHNGVARVVDGKFGGDNKHAFIGKNGDYLIKPNQTEVRDCGRVFGRFDSRQDREKMGLRGRNGKNGHRCEVRFRR